MVMTRQEFLSLMVEGLRKVYFDQYKDVPSVYPQIYDEMPSKKRREDFQSITPIGMLDTKPEGENMVYEDFGEGYSKQFLHTAWAKGMRVTRELIDDEQYSVMGRRTKLLAKATAYRKEYEHAKLFNNATTTTYFTGQDGLALLSASHTLAAKPGVTWSNTAGAVDLSLTSLDSAFAAIRRYVDDMNQLIMLEPATLLIPPELERTAVQLLNSSGLPGSADNDTNYYKGKLKIVTWKFLTDTDAWGILVPKSDIAPLSFNRVPPEFERDSDFDSKNLKVSVYTRFSNGFIDPRFYYGGTG
jgi:phage major head subunit gpT-like protein